MDPKIQSLDFPKRISGWFFIFLALFSFAGLFLLNYSIPLENGTYSMRIWNWAKLSLASGALLVLLFNWRVIDFKSVAIGAVLGLISGFSRAMNSSFLWEGVTESIAVWLTFIAGVILFRGIEKNKVMAFQSSPTNIARNLGIGILIAIPLAALNNLFFFLQNGAPRFQNLFGSAFEALSPGIHEEVIYRFFILAGCFSILKNSTRPRLALITALILGVVPHSLLHLPDLFLENPLMGLAMLVVTSLLFGLPMALLQIKRSFETAVVFHWFIDFARFFFGY